MNYNSAIGSNDTPKSREHKSQMLPKTVLRQPVPARFVGRYAVTQCLKRSTKI